MALSQSMEKKHRKGISTFSAQITATVSVALVLMLLGIISLLGIAAHSITSEIKENMGFSIVFSDTATDNQINYLKQRITTAPYVSSMRYFSAADAMNKWKEDTGEDLMQVLGVNPFSPELEVKVKADYADVDSIGAIVAPISSLPYISDINVHTEMVDAVNANIKSITIILTAIAAVLLFISFALINNTIRLSVYSRRFTIHTMKLVGATGAFIRKPFLTGNLISGLVAGIVADAILAGALAYFHTLDKTIREAVTWPAALCVFAGVIVLGMLICFTAAVFATNKYLRSSYDDMFK